MMRADKSLRSKQNDQPENRQDAEQDQQALILVSLVRAIADDAEFFRAGLLHFAPLAHAARAHHLSFVRRERLFFHHPPAGAATLQTFGLALLLFVLVRLV